MQNILENADRGNGVGIKISGDLKPTPAQMELKLIQSKAVIENLQHT